MSNGYQSLAYSFSEKSKSSREPWVVLPSGQPYDLNLNAPMGIAHGPHSGPKNSIITHSLSLSQKYSLTFIGIFIGILILFTLLKHKVYNHSY